ncbi:hypothetical protein [Clostridium botulinum]|nr:hypothetical protein [Clostridium botulinum]
MSHNEKTEKNKICGKFHKGIKSRNSLKNDYEQLENNTSKCL